MIVLFFVALLCGQIIAQSNNPCIGTVNGDMYDLTQFTNATGDWSWVQADPAKPASVFKFNINICQPIFDSQCDATNGPGFACCQRWGGQAVNWKYSAGLGKTSTMTLDQAGIPAGSKGVTAHFTGGGGGRSYEIDFVCSTTAGTGFPTYDGEIPAASLHYQFTWTSALACPGGNKGLSAGSIILIVLLCLVVVYIVAGVLVNRFLRHQQGLDLIPQKEFWFGLPFLVKDGFMFIINKVRGRGAGTTYQTVK